MKRYFAPRLMALLALCLVQAPASAQVGLRSTVVLRASATLAGQPIEFPLLRNQVTVVVAELPPGGQTGVHLHPFPVVVYVIAGTLRVELEGRPVQVFTAGQAYAEAVNHPHNVFNQGNTDAKFLIISAGQQRTPLLIRPTGSTPVGFRTAGVLETTKTGSGQIILFPLLDGQIVMALIEMAPGGETGTHRHPNPTVIYLIEGVLTLEEDGQPTKILNLGQAFVESVDLPLNHRNRGTVPLKMLAVFLAQEGVPLSIR